MKHLVRPWRRPVARVLMLALAVGSAPICCLAGEPPGPQQSQSTPQLAASIDKAVQHEVAVMAKGSPAVARQTGASSPGSSPSFFKTKVGIATIALVAAGTGFALYSTKHDRVTSPKVTYGGTWK